MGKKKKISREQRTGIPEEAILPEEVKLLQEFNKVHKDRYAEWVRRKMISEEILGKYTLVVGMRGQNGIVLGADTKVIRGGETDYENKVRKFDIGPQSPIVFASAGAVGVIEDFVEMFESTLRENISQNKINSLLSVKIIAENLVETTEERYAPKLQQPSLHFMLGGLSNLNKGKAVLYEISFPGYGQKIKYSTFIGHGSTYARTIGKYLFPRDNASGVVPLACKDIVDRVAFCIQWIGNDIDSYVGNDAQIMYLLDDKPEIQNGPFKKGKIKAQVKSMQETLKKVSFSRK